MPRSPIPSSLALVPASGMQARVVSHRMVYAAGDKLPPSVNVELAGVTKSTWKRQSFHVVVLASPFPRNGSGAPAGGGVEPSRSPGRNASDVGAKKIGSLDVTNVAEVPAIIAARLNANGCGPRNA